MHNLGPDAGRYDPESVLRSIGVPELRDRRRLRMLPGRRASSSQACGSGVAVVARWWAERASIAMWGGLTQFYHPGRAEIVSRLF